VRKTTGLDPFGGLVAFPSIENGGLDWLQARTVKIFGRAEEKGIYDGVF
jgi:hypothetical protein